MKCACYDWRTTITVKLTPSLHSPFDIFSATFRALGQCGQGCGGAASVGSEFFHASVAGAIPGTIAEDHNVTFVVAHGEI